MISISTGTIRRIALMRIGFLVYRRQRPNKCSFCRKPTTRTNKSPENTNDAPTLSFQISSIPFDGECSKGTERVNLRKTVKG